MQGQQKIGSHYSDKNQSAATHSYALKIDRLITTYQAENKEAQVYKEDGDQHLSLGRNMDAVACYTLSLDKDKAETRNTDTLYQRASAYRELGFHTAAAHDLEKIIYLQPGHENANKALVDCYLNSKSTDATAINFLTNFINTYPNYAEAYLALGQINLANEEFEVAKTFFNKAQRCSPSMQNKCIAAYEYEGELLNHCLKPENALYCFTTALELGDQKSAEYYKQRGDAYLMKDQYLRAISCYQFAIKIDNNNVEYKTNCQHAYFKLGNYYYAYKHYAYEKTKLSLIEFAYKQSLNLLADNTAEGYFNYGKSLDGKKDAEIYHYRAQAYAQLESLEIDYTQKALEDCEKSIQLDPSYSEHTTFLLLAHLYKEKLNLEKAKEVYLNVITRNGKNLQARCELAGMYLKENDLQSAETWYRSVIKLDVNFSAAYHGLGNLYYLKGELPAAIKAYNNAIISSPTKNPVYYNSRGIAHLTCKDYESALKDFHAIHPAKTDDLIIPGRNHAYTYYLKNKWRMVYDQLAFLLQFAANDPLVHCYYATVLVKIMPENLPKAILHYNKALTLIAASAQKAHYLEHLIHRMNIQALAKLPDGKELHKKLFTVLSEPTLPAEKWFARGTENYLPIESDIKYIKKHVLYWQLLHAKDAKEKQKRLWTALDSQSLLGSLFAHARDKTTSLDAGSLKEIVIALTSCIESECQNQIYLDETTKEHLKNNSMFLEQLHKTHLTLFNKLNHYLGPEVTKNLPDSKFPLLFYKCINNFKLNDTDVVIADLKILIDVIGKQPEKISVTGQANNAGLSLAQLEKLLGALNAAKSNPNLSSIIEEFILLLANPGFLAGSWVVNNRFVENDTKTLKSFIVEVLKNIKDPAIRQTHMWTGLCKKTLLGSLLNLPRGKDIPSVGHFFGELPVLAKALNQCLKQGDSHLHIHPEIQTKLLADNGLLEDLKKYYPELHAKLKGHRGQALDGAEQLVQSASSTTNANLTYVFEL